MADAKTNAGSKDWSRGGEEDSFADMIDRALGREFSEKSRPKQRMPAAVIIALPNSRSFQFHDVFHNENGEEDMPALIDRKDNIFIMSNRKSKYPVLQLDLRLISDLVVVIVSATCGGIAFACAGQPICPLS
ncbi:unnamed protein product [Malus baccata var. baccata]